MKELYSISEVARILKVPTSKIRYWESEFNIPSLKLGSGAGIRHYRVKEVNTLKKILELMETREYTQKGIKKRINGTEG